MMQLFELNEPKEVEVKSFSFNARGQRFEGKGRLKWDPTQGFRLEGYAKPTQILKGKIVIPIGQGGPLPQRCFRFDFNTSWKAFSPNVFFNNYQYIKLDTDESLTVDFYRLILFTNTAYYKEGSCPWGTTVYQVKENTDFPDMVCHEVKVADQIISSEQKLEGLSIDNEFIKLVGFLNKKNHFEVFWEPTKRSFTRREEWSISTALKYALSLCLGQTVFFIKRDIYRKNKTIVELTKPGEVKSLGLFAPVMKESLSFDKGLFHRLFEVFLKNNKESIIIRNLFYRIADALRTQNSELWAFMISSSLEAFLRTYYDKPYPKKFSCKDSLKQFRLSHFKGANEQEWEQVFEVVLNCYKKFRHKNAHPDWHNDISNISQNIKQKDFEDLIFLSDFYGYLILALVGYKNLEPKALRNRLN